METIFLVASVGFFCLAACCLFEKNIPIARTASAPTPIKSPFGFISPLLQPGVYPFHAMKSRYRSRYLRFHHVASPKPTTPSGKMMMLSQNISRSRYPVTFSAWSSGVFGRIEIKSSSDESQFTELTNRSRLPSWRDPAKLFTAHNDVPDTTNRPCLVPEYVPAATRVSGPFLPFFGSTCPPGPISLVAMLSSVVATSLSTDVFAPAFVSS